MGQRVTFICDGCKKEATEIVGWLRVRIGGEGLTISRDGSGTKLYCSGPCVHAAVTEYLCSRPARK